MALTGIAPPRRIEGLDETTKRQFNEWFEWIERLMAGMGSGLIPPVFLSGASNEITQDHVGKYLVVAHASACVLTLSSATLAAMPLGAPVYMVQAGAGQLTLTASGVTVRTAETLKTRKQWSSMMFVKTERTVAILNGDLELA